MSKASEKWVHIVTRLNPDDNTATVVSHHETAREASARCRFMDYGGCEGPVRATDWPVGKVFPIDGDEAEEWRGN